MANFNSYLENVEYKSYLLSFWKDIVMETLLHNMPL